MIRIKICGVTTPDDAAAISGMGADAIGLNFIPESPRCIHSNQVTGILDAIMPFTSAVGLVNLASDFNWFDCVDRIPILQVYNWVSDYWNHSQRMILPFRIQSQSDLTEIGVTINRMKQAESDPPYAIILDAYDKQMLGGTGHVAPWHLLAGFDPGVPVILAGGLTPDNVAEAIRIVKPWGVDVASGVEKSPGVKDLAKVKAFIDAARAASAAL